MLGYARFCLVKICQALCLLCFVMLCYALLCLLCLLCFVLLCVALLCFLCLAMLLSCFVMLGYAWVCLVMLGSAWLGLIRLGYAWLVWENGNIGPTRLIWIPPCRRDLERDDDYELPRSQIREIQGLNIVRGRQSEFFT